MRPYRSINLRLWLPIIILGALVLMMTCLSLWHYREHTRELERESLERIERRLVREKLVLESLLNMGEQGLVAEFIAELGALAEVDYAALIDERGQVLYASQPLWRGKSLHALLPQGAPRWLLQTGQRQLALEFSVDRNILYAHQPVRMALLPGEIRSSRVGTLIVQYSLHNAKALAARAFFHENLGHLAVGTLVMLLLMLLLDQWLARPLGYLRDVVGKISEGRFDTAVNIVGDGELAGLAAAVNRMQADLARINAAQQSAQKELAEFKNTLDQIQDGVVIARTEDFRFLYVNQGVQQQLGYSEAELLTMSPLDIVPGCTLSLLRQRIQPLLDGHLHAINLESLHRHKNGQIHPVEVCLQLIPQQNEISRFVVVIRDISARKRAEADLLASETRFRALFEQAGVGAAVIETASRRFIRINKKFADILGYSVEEMLNVDFALITLPDDLSADLAQMERLKTGEIREYAMEKRYICRDGNIRWVNLTVSPTWEIGAPVDCHVAVVEDITSRKQSEALLNSQMMVLEMIARSEPLERILTRLINAVEAQAPQMICSILLLDASGQHLHHCAAPGLPLEYMRHINGQAIGPLAGSCGTAAFRRETIIVSDIATDPLWADFAHLALDHHLRACWSTPIVSSGQQVLGTFAVYYKTPMEPPEQHRNFIAMATHTAAIAIERLRTEAALNDAADYTRVILDNVADGIITTDRQGIVESFNNSAARIFGYAAHGVIGQFVNQIMPGLHAEQRDQEITPTSGMLARVIGKRREVDGKRSDGTVFPMELTVSRVLHNRQLKLIALVNDISERRLNEEKIQRLTFYDPLTELPNRRLLMDRLHRALTTCARSGSLGALLLLDLDHFKNLNDTHGHDAGDLLLCQVAQRLRRCARESDTVARLGGDEFVIVLEDLDHDTQEAASCARLVGENILALLSQTYLLNGVEHYSSPSIGITLFNKSIETVDALLKRADVAMYQAKAAGRNTLQFFDSDLQASLAARTLLEADMRLGLAQGQFLLHYQPQVDGEGKVIGVEALLRWQHPLNGMVPPVDFIAVAEQSGFILPLGQWVLQNACEQLVIWGLTPATAQLTLAVNVSARQFRQIGFVEQVLDVIQRTGADPTRIKLELTESLLISNLDDVTDKMRALKSCGVGFSLDDFGTGYSSLGYLRQLPLDQLKIDQSFVRDVLIDSNDAVIARTIIGLGLSLGLSVIAEGVETEGQRFFLAENGCHSYQGYLFSPPLPVNEFNAWLESRIAVIKS